MDIFILIQIERERERESERENTLSILAFIGQISGSTRTSLNRARTIDIYAGR